MPEKDNGRTHEPKLRELTANLDGLRQLIDERDRRYEERFLAMDEKTSLALAASEKAVGKAETATEKRFEGVNEFRGQLEDQAKRLVTRDEYNVAHTNLAEKVEMVDANVRRIENLWGQFIGGKEKASEGRQQNQWVIGIAVVLGIAIAEIAFKLINK